MWQRSELKNNAKMNLTRKYWQAFAVTLVVGLLSGGSGLFSFNFNLNDIRLGSGRFDLNLENLFGRIQRFIPGGSQLPFDPNVFQDFHFAGFWLLALLAGLLAGSVGIAYGIFVSPVIQVGGNRWFSRSRESVATPSIGMIFSLFKSGKYLKTVGGMLWMNLFLFLWGLLAAIPFVAGITWALAQYIGQSMNWPGYGLPEQYYNWLGGADAARFVFLLLLLAGSTLLSLPVVIKYYSYRMTPWILADNPAIGYKRALKLSMQLTRGHKWRIFVLDLSFIGWFLLGAIACGIGTLFVMPYYMAVYAELYARLRRLGVDQNMCTMEELGFFPVDPGQFQGSAAPQAPEGRLS